MADEEDPLIKALPPATDYLTYLTVLEYQLTPARLPLLHRVLQDEKLTTNIGWDLVQLLLPLLPESQECLQDVARLGNPREVILRVSDALMNLQREETDEDGGDESTQETERAEPDLGSLRLGGEEAGMPEVQKLSLPVLKFNCLVSMLSILHSRIKTKHPSRFLATSLQAVLEAYTIVPTAETTMALLEFFRDASGSKRPALPPRDASEKFVARPTESPAPDPEAEVHLENTPSEEKTLVQRLVQFGLIEVLKTYLLHCTHQKPSGMQWTIRLQEKLDQQMRLPESLSRTHEFDSASYLKERDRTVGKITALSRDFDLSTECLLSVISREPGIQPPPLDFEDFPTSAAEVPLERHGCLLLLAARFSTAILFSSEQTVEEIPLFPDVAKMFSNFIRQDESPSSKEFEEPEVLIDALLALTEIASDRPFEIPQDETIFDQFILSLTRCTRATGFRNIGRIGRVPSAIFHKHPDALVRYNLIRKILEDDSLQYAREPVISWLKQEILTANAAISDAKETKKVPGELPVFVDPDNFGALFPHIFPAVPQSWLALVPGPRTGSADDDDLMSAWITFTQELHPFYLSALNLCYLLSKSSVLRTQLQLDKHLPYFQEQFLTPVKTFMYALCQDAETKARIDQQVGPEAESMGHGCAELVLHVIQEIEEILSGD